MIDKPYFEDGTVELAKKCLDRALLEMGTTLENFPTITLSQRNYHFISTTASTKAWGSFLIEI